MFGGRNVTSGESKGYDCGNLNRRMKGSVAVEYGEGAGGGVSERWSLKREN